MKYRWSIAQAQPLLADSLAKQLACSPLLAQCLINRNLSDPGNARQFISPRLKSLADPFLLPNMDLAVERLLRARAEQTPLVIFGDYDVDGVTSTALLYEFLTGQGWQAHHYLPHRMDEGYGLSRDGVENCLRKYPVNLLLAVDCGSTTVATIAWLREQGVDVIVLDHHQVSNPAPVATALVNPQLLLERGVKYGQEDFTELCSAGLAFKLVHALVKRGREQGLPGFAAYDLRPLLDLVALGTIADIVPLTGENRILTTVGLERLNSTRRPGLQMLKEVSQTTKFVGVHEVGFQLAPRLNAAGRMETANAALELLLAKDVTTAMPLAQALDVTNRERQETGNTTVEQILADLRPRFDASRDWVIVEGQPAWHLGVVGIVASRVLHEFYRPTIILGGDGDHWRGSGRSIEGFDLAAALRECDDLLVKHGGHAMAAGVSIRPENLPALRARLNELVQKALPLEQFQPALRLDAEVALGDLTLERIKELEQLRPFGQQNPSPQLFARRLNSTRAPLRMGANKQHVKLWVTDTSCRIVEAVWWGAGEAIWPTGNFDLAFAPQVNSYNGATTVQLKVLDWRPAE
ncbi:MAG: single-stranded-DNA-specific exonuclease RecJ [Verrucomicrobiota bacterium]